VCTYQAAPLSTRIISSWRHQHSRIPKAPSKAPVAPEEKRSPVLWIPRGCIPHAVPRRRRSDHGALRGPNGQAASTPSSALYSMLQEPAAGNLSNFSGTGLAPGVYLRCVAGIQHPVFRIELLDSGTSVPYRVDATSSLLRLRASKESIEICIPESDQVRFRGNGVSLGLVAVGSALAISNEAEHWEINSESPIEKYMLLGNARPTANGCPVERHFQSPCCGDFFAQSEGPHRIRRN
jgi:hypothetical protein